MKAKIVFALVALLALHAPAVSRVGGGKVRSNSSGFELLVPESFGQIKEARSTVTAFGPNLYVSGQGLISQYINIAEFADEFPDFVNYSAEQLEQRLTAAHWQVLPRSSESCALGLRFASSQVVVYVITWGHGKGLVLKSPRVGITEDAIKEMLSTLVLDPGACAWN